MMSNPLATPSAEQVEKGVAVVTAEDNRWQRCDLKTISLVGNVLMRQLAADAGAIETVMFRDGYLTEASASNVLVVIGGTIVAPPKDNLILPGITYGAAYEFAREAGMPFEIRPVTRAEALGADEMWLTSSTKEVIAVTTIDGRAVRGRSAGPDVPQDARALPGAQAAARVTASRLTRATAWSVAPVVEHQRRGPCPRAGLDLADEEHVVAGAGVRGGGTRTSRRSPRSAERRPRRADKATPAKRSACGREKRRASSTWSCASTLIA